MATRIVQLRDTVESPSALTLNLFARGTSSAGTPEFSGNSTVSGDVHSWSLVDLTAGDYDVIIISGTARVWTGSYTHADADETVQLVDCGVVETSIVVSLTTLLSRITANVGTWFTAMYSMITGYGVSPKFTTTALSNAPSGGGGGGETTSFSAAALAQLSGRSVTVTLPAYNSNTERFDLPFTRGDSYLGGNAIQLTISNWTGQDLDAADSITINGTRRVDFDDNGTLEAFSWTGGTATASGSNWVVEFELDTTDTDITAGDYIWSMVAEWADGDRVTIVKNSLLTIDD